MKGGKRTYATDEEKALAVRLYADLGPAEASRQTGWAKSTIINWAHKAGVKVTPPEEIQKAVEHRKARHELSMQEWREEITSQLRELSLLAASLEMTMAPNATDLSKVSAMRQKAISDLMLVTGEPTNRTEIRRDMTGAREATARLRDELAERREKKKSA